MTCKHIWAGQTRLKLKHHSRLETGRIRILYGQYKGLARRQARSTLTLPKTDLGRPLKLETNLFWMKETQNKLVKTGYQFRNWLKYDERSRRKREKGNLAKMPILCYLLYSWKFFPNSARSHWLLRGHMTADTISNNETVSRQNIWAGNTAKSMTPESKSAPLPANIDQRPPLQQGLMNIQPQNFQLYNKSLKDWSLRKQFILSPSNFKILGKQNKLCPEGPVIKCLKMRNPLSLTYEYITIAQKETLLPWVFSRYVGLILDLKMSHIFWNIWQHTNLLILSLYDEEKRLWELLKWSPTRENGLIFCQILSTIL